MMEPGFWFGLWTGLPVGAIAILLVWIIRETRVACDRARLIELLKGIDAQQQVTDERGQREIAWYYARDRIEDVLQLPRGELDCPPEEEAAL